MKIKALAEKYMELFAGLDRAHGQYDMRNPTTTSSGKVKGKATTKYVTITLQHWVDHLEGTMGLGIVPIRDDGTVMFAAMDIDDYNPDLDYIIQKCREAKLIPVLSKSGGVHAYVFLKEPAPASVVRKKLTMIRASMGYADCEIFPKQDRLISAERDVGNWLNAPYFNHEDSTRFGCDYRGQGLSSSEFLRFVEDHRVTLEEFIRTSVSQKSEAEHEDIPDGPPCLQHLTEHGFPAGSRNNGLFDLAVYYRKSSPDSWTHLVEEANRKWMSPGSAEEVAAIIRSVKRKVYAYKCKERPICDHCNKDLCKTRKYGVGEARDLPSFTGLTKILTEPPMYFVSVDGVRLGPIPSDVLLNQHKLAQTCFDQANLMLMRMKPEEFHEVLKAASETVNEIEMPEDSRESGILIDHLIMFVKGPQSTENKSEILIGRVWMDDGKYYFKLRDFTTYLARVNFKTYRTNELTTMLREKGLRVSSVRINGEVVGVWVFEYSEEEGSVEIPETKKKDKL